MKRNICIEITTEHGATEVVSVKNNLGVKEEYRSDIVTGKKANFFFHFNHDRRVEHVKALVSAWHKEGVKPSKRYSKHFRMDIIFRIYDDTFVRPLAVVNFWVHQNYSGEQPGYRSSKDASSICSVEQTQSDWFESLNKAIDLAARIGNYIEEHGAGDLDEESARNVITWLREVA